MTQVSIETIGGKKCTVIMYGDESYEEAMPTHFRDRHGYNLHAYRGIVAGVMLDALPRRPKPEDAALLFRYCSEGIVPVFGGVYAPIIAAALMLSPRKEWYEANEITHAIDAQGNRVEIAITDEESK